MEKTNILLMRNDSKFFYNLGVKSFKQNEVRNSIKNFNKALSLSTTIEDRKICLDSLAGSYAVDGSVELSNLHYFLLSKYDDYYERVLLDIADNFLITLNIPMCEYYLQRILKECNNDKLKDEARKRINQISLYTFKKVEYKSLKKHLEKARKLMLQERFKEALSEYNKAQMQYDEQVRSEMSFAYFLQDDMKGAINLLEEHGNSKSVKDLSNLVFAYHFNGELLKEQQTMDKLKAMKSIPPRETFKIGLMLVQMGKYNEGISYMEKSFTEFGSSEIDIKLEKIYAYSLMLASDFEKSRRKLIDLKEIDPISSYIYDYYIKLCYEKRTDNIVLDSEVQLLDYKENLEKIINFLKISNEDLIKEFKTNQAFFYYLLLLQNHPMRNELVCKLAKGQDRIVDTYFDYLFLLPNVDAEIKEQLVYERLLYSLSSSNICIVNNDILTRFVLPNDFVYIRENNKELFEAIRSTIGFFLSKLPNYSLNLNKIVEKVSIFTYSKKDLNQDFLSTLLTFLSVKTIKHTKKMPSFSLDDICAFYDIKKEKFLKVAEELSIII